MNRSHLRRFAKVCGVCVMVPSSYVAQGDVASYSDPLVGVPPVGRYPGGSDDLVERVCADFERSGVGRHPSTVVMRWKYTQLLASLGNTLEAIRGPIESEASLDLPARARAEGERTLRRAGTDFRRRAGGLG